MIEAPKIDWKLDSLRNPYTAGILPILGGGGADLIVGYLAAGLAVVLFVRTLGVAPNSHVNLPQRGAGGRARRGGAPAGHLDGGPGEVVAGLAVEADGLDAVVEVDVLAEGEDGHVVEERVDVEVLVPDHALHGVRLGRHDVEGVLYILQTPREGERVG